MLQLDSETCRSLRAQAHGLNPVVSISQNGLTDAVLKEIDLCLKAHALIKIRIYGDSREARAEYLQAICETLDAAPVQQIGKLLVIWRPLPEEETPSTQRHPGRKPPRRTKRSFQGE